MHMDMFLHTHGDINKEALPSVKDSNYWDGCNHLDLLLSVTVLSEETSNLKTSYITFEMHPKW